MYLQDGASLRVPVGESGVWVVMRVWSVLCVRVRALGSLFSSLSLIHSLSLSHTKFSLSVSRSPALPISCARADARVVLAQVLEAMDYLHKEKRVIHRDVKPGNILLNRQGRCKLADFGVCRSLLPYAQSLLPFARSHLPYARCLLPSDRSLVLHGRSLLPYDRSPCQSHVLGLSCH